MRGHRAAVLVTGAWLLLTPPREAYDVTLRPVPREFQLSPRWVHDATEYPSEAAWAVTLRHSHDVDRVADDIRGSDRGGGLGLRHYLGEVGVQGGATVVEFGAGSRPADDSVRLRSGDLVRVPQISSAHQAESWISPPCD